MRLGDFRKQTEHLPDDVVLSNLWGIDICQGYYDGYTINLIEDWKVEISNDNKKINIYLHDDETKYHDVRKENLSYEENLEIFLSYYIRGKNISDEQWNRETDRLTRRFKYFWEEEHKENNNEM